LIFKIKSLADLEKFKPGILTAVKTWFKVIKTHDGKKPNSFLYEESFHDPAKAHEIIEFHHRLWKELTGTSDPKYKDKRQEFNIK
jgi:hypothetical protein